MTMLQTLIVPLPITSDSFLRAVLRNGTRRFVPEYEATRSVTLRVTMPFEKTIVLNQELLWESIRKQLIANEIISASEPCDYDFRYAYSAAIIDGFKGEVIVEIEEMA